jgi:hypothetical protein
VSRKCASDAWASTNTSTSLEISAAAS